MKRSSIKRRTPIKTSSAMRRGKPLVYRGRRNQTRILKSGRVVMNAADYEAECLKVWERDKSECQIRRPGCQGKLPGFSTRWCDHIKKRSQGGSDTMDNLRLACLSCHDWADNCGGKLLERDLRATEQLDRLP